MKIVTQDGPTINGIAGANPKEIGPSARERAINKYLNADKNSTQTVSSTGESRVTKAPLPGAEALPVSNPTQVSPEEMGAIKSTESQRIENNIEAPSIEAPKEVKTDASTTEDEPLSNQYALLARKEKALRAKAQAASDKLKADREAFEAEKRALQAKESEYQTKYIPKDRLRSDLPSILAEMGLSSEEISNVIYNAPKPEEVALNGKLSAYETRIKQLEDKIEASSKSYEEREKASYDQALNQIHYDVKKLVNNDEAFEVIKATNSTQKVVDKIKEKFDTDGELLDIYEAAELVENELFEEYLKASKLKKIQDKLGFKSEASKSVEAQPKAAPTQSQPLKTLTNAMSSTRRLSARERALKAFKGEQQ